MIRSSASAQRRYDNVKGAKAWYDARKANLHNRLTAADVLARNGVQLRFAGSQEEQISCPFHGADRKPSARYFPTSDRSHSHVWCYVCQEHWDIIGLWKRYSGAAKYSDVLSGLERSFGVSPPESTFVYEKPEDPLAAEVDDLLEQCERYLRNEQESLPMLAALRLGSILDGLRYDVELKLIGLPDARERARALMERIGDKTRAAASASAAV